MLINLLRLFFVKYIIFYMLNRSDHEKMDKESGRPGFRFSTFRSFQLEDWLVSTLAIEFKTNK